MQKQHISAAWLMSNGQKNEKAMIILQDKGLLCS
jgi:hypothetical protein